MKDNRFSQAFSGKGFMKLLGKFVIGMVALLAMLLVLSTANASNWYIDYYEPSGLSFQIYSGTGWEPLAMYHFYDDGWYYFNQPFRYEYSGNWYYYQQGWYNFYPSWYSAPYSYNYGYYPVDYYYSGSGWNYYPNWYSNSVYYSPYVVTNYGYYWTPYGFGNNSASKFYEQKSKCEFLEITIDDVKVSPGTSATTSFKVYNASRYNMEIKSIDFYVDSFDSSISVGRYSKTISPKKSASIPFTVYLAKSDYGTVNANLKMRVQFADGKYCNAEDIVPRDFVIFSDPIRKAQPANWQSNVSTAYSTSYMVDNESNDESVYTAPASAPAEPEPVVAQFEPVGNCSAVDLSTKNITTQAGEEASELFMLRNYNMKKFYIDKVEMYDYSNDFELSAEPTYNYAFENSDLQVKVTARGSNISKDSYGTGYISLQGHFDNGPTCVLDKQFYVYVNTTPESDCDQFSISIEPELESSGNGAVLFNFENSRNAAAKVLISGEHLNVQTAEVKIPAGKAGSRMIQFDNFNSAKGAIYYQQVSAGCNYPVKITYVEQPAPVTPTVIETKGITVLDYPLQVEMTAENARLAITLKNSSDRARIVQATVAGLPNALSATNTAVEFAPGETKTFYLEVSGIGAVAGEFDAKLLLAYDDVRLTRDITIKKNSDEAIVPVVNPTNPPANTSDSNSNAISAFSTALVSFADAYFYGILVVIAICIIALFYYATRTPRIKQIWE